MARDRLWCRGAGYEAWGESGGIDYGKCGWVAWFSRNMSCFKWVQERVHCWQDRWCGEEVLRARFLLICRLVVDLEARARVVWGLVLRQQVQDLEVGQLLDLLTFFYGVQVRGKEEDALVWGGPSFEGFVWRCGGGVPLASNLGYRCPIQGGFFCVDNDL
ncbi:hypothetical protein CsSME_00002481 [Camellia sinensis var. sinensis]